MSRSTSNNQETPPSSPPAPEFTLNPFSYRSPQSPLSDVSEMSPLVSEKHVSFSMNDSPSFSIKNNNVKQGNLGIQSSMTPGRPGRKPEAVKEIVSVLERLRLDTPVSKSSMHDGLPKVNSSVKSIKCMEPRNQEAGRITILTPVRAKKSLRQGNKTKNKILTNILIKLNIS